MCAVCTSVNYFTLVVKGSRRGRTDVVLMDLSLGDGPGGAETTRLVRDLPSPTQVLVLTTYDTEADVLAAGAVATATERRILRP